MRCRCSNGAGPPSSTSGDAPSFSGGFARGKRRYEGNTQWTFPMLDMPSNPCALGADYPTVKRAIEFISTRWRDQPSVEAIAEHVGLSPSHFQFVFKRWAGLTPKAFLQSITIERARERLRDSATVLDAAYDVGLSGPGRLHDLFVAHESLTPGDYRRDDLALSYGFHSSPFGEAIVVAAPRGMAGLWFLTD